MAATYLMAQQSLDNRLQGASRTQVYPAAALSEVASAALADAGPSSESDSSQTSLRYHAGRSMPLVPKSSNGSVGGSLTDDTSPKSAFSAAGKQSEVDGARDHRLHTPEQRGLGIALQASPPLKQGAKRTASGAVKDANGYSALAEVPSNYASRGHVRAKSSVRAVEISNALKTRLAYAMVKVTNGWENQNLDQLEASSRLSSPSLTSPSTTSPTRRRFSMNSDYNDRYLTSPNLRHSPQQRFGQQQAYVQYSPPAMQSAAPAFVHTHGVPTLAPAAPIAPGRGHRRSLSKQVPPHLSTAYANNGFADQGVYNSQPTTPRRQGILRMPSQQAEKDALDSLLFMASPNNSANLKYTDSPAGPSPLRVEFPAAVKRVVFDR